MKNLSNILPVIGILIALNFLSRQFFLRYDLTEDKQFTLSKATKDILRSLKDGGEPVTITAYFSEDLPTDVAKVKRDFQDLLVEYANLSNGFVDYEFVNPVTDEQKQQAAQAGIQPVMINVREKDQMKAQQAFLGAVMKMGSRQDVIPVIQPGMAMEYALSTGIKKMAVVDKPSIGILTGFGGPGLQELGQAFQQLSILYNVEEIDLKASETIEPKFKTVALIAPKDTILAVELSKIDAYLQAGGNLYLAINAVEGDLQNQSGFPFDIGLAEWLRAKGLEVEPSFVLDEQCGSVTISQQNGFFTMQTPVAFPYLPLISNFADHPVAKGIEQIVLTFGSPVKPIGNVKFTPIAYTSRQSAIEPAPVTFDIMRRWTTADFPLSNIVVAGVLEPGSGGKIILVGDGDFPISGQRGQNADNINFLVNGIDWLSDDTGLIDLRTKGATTRPIDPLEDGTRTLLKYLNFLLPILLVLIYGFIRFQKQRALRYRRMQENYN